MNPYDECAIEQCQSMIKKIQAKIELLSSAVDSPHQRTILAGLHDSMEELNETIISISGRDEET